MAKFRITCSQQLLVTQEATFVVEAESQGHAIRQVWEGKFPRDGWHTTSSVIKDYNYTLATVG